jgi:hypothetical protein
MTENALDKLKKEAKERKLERKIETTRRKQVEKDKVKHVGLTGAIYIEPLASCELIAKELRIFEQEQESRELEEELKAIFDFF